MNSIVQRGEAAIWYLVGDPANRHEGAVLVCLGVLTMVIMLGRLSQALHMKRKGALYAILGSGLSLAALLASVYGVRNYLSPQVGFPGSYVGTVLLSIVVSFVVVVPVLSLVQRTELLSAAMAWGTAIVAAACVVVIARVGFGVMESGSVKAQETLDRSMEMEAFLEQQ